MITILMITINNVYISILPISPRASGSAHIPPEEDRKFDGKNC